MAKKTVVPNPLEEAPPPVDFKKIKLMIGTPMYGPVPPEYVSSMIDTTRILLQHGVSFMFMSVAGCCYVTNARNMIFAKFMGGEFTHLLFIDSDMVWKGEDVMNLLSSPKELTVITYRKKMEPLNFTVNFKVGPGGQISAEQGFLEIEEAGTGFMLIQKSVGEKMIGAYSKGRQYRCTATFLDDHDKQYLFNFFDTDIQDGAWVSEDFVFCRLWKKIGGKVWLYPNSIIDHMGPYRWTARPDQLVKVVDQKEFEKLQKEKGNGVTKPKPDLLPGPVAKKKIRPRPRKRSGVSRPVPREVQADAH